MRAFFSLFAFNSYILRCPEDVAEMTGFSSVGFGTSSRHLIKQDASIQPKQGLLLQKRTAPYFEAVHTIVSF